MRWVIIGVMWIVVWAGVAGQEPQPVSDDQVNEIASQLYCPVCENIPLDACGTAACQDWREEIRDQLASGMSEQAIVDDFVRRFGDRVVGTPQDPLLRALSLATPFVVIGLAAAGLAYWLMLRRPAITSVPAVSAADATDWRAQIERDVQGG